MSVNVSLMYRKKALILSSRRIFQSAAFVPFSFCGARLFKPLRIPAFVPARYSRISQVNTFRLSQGGRRLLPERIFETLVSAYVSYFFFQFHAVLGKNGVFGEIDERVHVCGGRPALVEDKIRVFFGNDGAAHLQAF